jgi:2'-hydroxyisoflavone reductase
MKLLILGGTQYGAGGIFAFDNRRGMAQGLTFRPLSETVSDTLAWDAAHDTPKAGLSLEQERALLEKWRAQQHPS